MTGISPSWDRASRTDARDHDARRQRWPLIMRVAALGSGSGRAGLMGVGLSLILLAWMFWPSLTHLVWTWSSDENYSHGFLVPLISYYFANEAARRGSVVLAGGVAGGVALLTLCVLGRLLTAIVPIGILSDLSFLIGIAGLVALSAGTNALRRYAFSIGFLVFMIPLPIALYSALASPLQLLVSRMGTTLLNAIGVPVVCHGNMMTLPGDVNLFVAEACSGMRQLTGFLALTTAVGHLSPKPAWYRAALVISAVPIAITANVLRVATTAWLAYAVDPSLASGHFHTLEGLLMMGVGLGMLMLECAVLNSLIEPSHPVGRSAEAQLKGSMTTSQTHLAARRTRMSTISRKRERSVRVSESAAHGT